MEKTPDAVRFDLGSLLGKVLIILLVPIILVNVYLIIGSYQNPNVPPHLFGYTPLIVQSGSMDDGAKDAIKVGDLVLVKNADGNERYQKGDIITYKQADDYVTHEIIDVKTEGSKQLYQTKGRANNTADQEVVKSSQILGEAMMNVPKMGDVLMFLQTPLGLVTTVGGPLLLMMGYDQLKLWLKKKEEKRNEKLA